MLTSCSSLLSADGAGGVGNGDCAAGSGETLLAASALCEKLPSTPSLALLEFSSESSCSPSPAAIVWIMIWACSASFSSDFRRACRHAARFWALLERVSPSDTYLNARISDGLSLDSSYSGGRQLLARARFSAFTVRIGMRLIGVFASGDAAVSSPPATLLCSSSSVRPVAGSSLHFVLALM
uniref:Uncharacterized protein n=1 Tax=Anopheles melas TaxID=34690 RepID=A0A182U0K8_9DIPT